MGDPARRGRRFDGEPLVEAFQAVPQALAATACALLAACDSRSDATRLAHASAQSGDAAARNDANPSANSQRPDRSSEASNAEADSTRLGALRASTLPAGFELVTCGFSHAVRAPYVVYRRKGEG